MFLLTFCSSEAHPANIVNWLLTPRQPLLPLSRIFFQCSLASISHIRISDSFLMGCEQFGVGWVGVLFAGHNLPLHECFV